MSMLSDLGDAAKNIIGAIAPTAATILGGPLAGLATQKIITALGLPADSTPDQIGLAVAAATPEQLLELKKVDALLEVDLKKLDVNALEIMAGDSASARQREITLKDYTPRILAGIVLSLYVAINVYIFAGYGLDVTMRDLALRSLGTLDASVGLILSYYFGSSLGSHNKDSQITSLTEKIK
jgi:hypothetical protein